MFNRTVVVDLLEKLFGETQGGKLVVRDPYEYITDPKNYDPDEKTKYSTQSTVVNAKTINEQLQNTTYGGVVRLGGLDWILASMTLGGYDSTTETEGTVPVLTLYLADTLTNAGGVPVMSNWLNVAPSEAGANMYSSSLIRNNIAFLSGDAGSDCSKLAMFNNSSAWAQKYLVQPKDIKYQHTVTHLDRGWRSYFYGNEGLDAEKYTTSFKSNGYTGRWNISQWNTTYTDSNFEYDGTKNNGGGRVAKYSEWGNDYIWLPCATETGWNSSTLATQSVWKLTIQQNSATKTSYLRSTNYDSIAGKTWLTTDGGYGCDTSGVRACGVRPAIHLDLTPFLRLTEPVETFRDYDGEPQTLEGEDWYRDEIFNDKTLCTVTYRNKNNEVVSPAPKEVGDYTVSITLKTDDCVWDGVSTSKTRTAKYHIVPKKLEVDFSTDSRGVPQLSLVGEPFGDDEVNCVIRYYDKDTGDDMGTEYSELPGKTWYIAYAEFDNSNYAPDPDFAEPIEFENPATPVNIVWYEGEGKKTFTGGNVSFTIDWGRFKDVVEIEYDDSVIDFDGWDEFTAKNAGKYSIALKLTNTQDYIWGSKMGKASGKTTDATIEFEILPKELELQVVSITPSDWTVTKGGTCDLFIDLPAVPTGPLDVVIYAQRTANSKPIEICAAALTATMQSSVPCEFVTDNITSAATYMLGVKVYNDQDPNAKNYTFKLDKEYTLTVKEPTSASGLLWRLFEDNRPAGSMQYDAVSRSTTWDKPITYNGSIYHFTVNASGLNYTVDTSFGTNGYQTVEKGKNSPLSSIGKAGTYVTTVRLNDSTTSYDYTIEWTIEKAKFDLSNVRWIEDGKISFNEHGMTVALIADTIPSGMTASYGGVHSATAVGDKGTATVQFAIADSVNYVQPVSTDKNSYIFKSSELDDFEWSKEWEVSPREIPVSWTIGTVEVDKKKINAEIIGGGFDEYIEYVYYETDNSGTILDPGAAPLKEPAITDNQIRFYKAEARIKGNYEGKYIFDPEAAVDLLSPVFEVGRALTAVRLEAKKTEYTYWGSAVAFQYNITQGAIAASSFDVVYYRGMIRLLAAPTDPGAYRAQVSLKSSFTGSYYIDGTNSFDFTIVRGTIAVKWNDNVKPPVLNLTQNEAKFISYEYRDSAGNTVAASALRTPGTYAVIARITDTLKYIFDDDTSVTNWLEFEVKSGDSVTDPSTSTPTYTPTVDPNGNGSNPGETGKTPLYLTLSNPQVYAGANFGAQFTNNAQLPSDAFIVTYKQNGQVVADYSGAGYYQIEVSWNTANPMYQMYADQYELLSKSFMFTVLPNNGNSGGEDPGIGNLGGDGVTGEPGSNRTIESILPIILSGVSLVLIVVFTIMTMNYASAARAAREKTKKLAQISYSVSPMSLLLLFGFSQTNWWIVAGVLMGLALLMAIVMLMFKGKKRKALEALDEEQIRVAEEKELAKEERMREEQLRREEQQREEQARRDNEMRMMFAAMQQNMQQPQMNYGDMQNMIASTVSALLPAMQQQMALPPAQDPNAYAAPQPDYAARAENEALKAQLAQQQELLNQILQNQQSQQAYDYDYEDDVQDDTSWLGESDEIISLEESYGNLNDEGRRAYYETGSYIMSKPRTSQNDGRYAVLFKYRGRTIFKLAIKDGAPVLYYPAGGGRAEVRIADPSSLETAKSMIDRTVMSFDGQM